MCAVSDCFLRTSLVRRYAVHAISHLRHTYTIVHHGGRCGGRASMAPDPEGPRCRTSANWNHEGTLRREVLPQMITHTYCRGVFVLDPTDDGSVRSH